MQKVMHAGILKAVGNIVYGEVPIPEFGDDEVIVKVKCAGICGSDVPRVKVHGTYKFPTIPGHEISGIIEAKGKNVKNAAIGDRVSIYPLIPCKSCDYCKAGDHNLCDNYDYIGSRCDGGFAEYVKCPNENVIKLPDNVSFEAGALLEPISVALHAINKSDSKPDDIAVVLGIGPIGTFTAQWLKILGAKTIIGVDRNREKFSTAKKLGFDYCFSSDDNFQNEIMKITNNNGADVILECSGSKQLQQASIGLAKRNGAIIFIGNPKEDILLKRVDLVNILRRELRIFGSWNSNITSNSVSEWNFSLQHLQDGKIKAEPVITHKFKLNEIKKVFDELYEKKFVHNKVVFVI